MLAMVMVMEMGMGMMSERVVKGGGRGRRERERKDGFIVLGGLPGWLPGWRSFFWLCLGCGLTTNTDCRMMKMRSMSGNPPVLPPAPLPPCLRIARHAPVR